MIFTFVLTEPLVTETIITGVSVNETLVTSVPMNENMPFFAAFGLGFIVASSLFFICASWVLKPANPAPATINPDLAEVARAMETSKALAAKATEESEKLVLLATSHHEKTWPLLEKNINIIDETLPYVGKIIASPIKGPTGIDPAAIEVLDVIARILPLLRLNQYKIAELLLEDGKVDSVSTHTMEVAAKLSETAIEAVVIELQPVATAATSMAEILVLANLIVSISSGFTLAMGIGASVMIYINYYK